jgi:hypothetical protein
MVEAPMFSPSVGRSKTQLILRQTVDALLLGYCAMSLPMDGDVMWDNPELVAFAQAARACYLAGNGYDHLKNILATVDELTPAEHRYSDPDDTFEKVFGIVKRKPDDL